MAELNRLDLLGKLQQPALAARVRAVGTSQSIVGPVVVEFDPTSYCDLACPNCVTANVLHNGRMAYSNIQDHLDSFSRLGVMAVILIGGGEPMMHPKFGQIVHDLHSRGMRVGVVTNGTQISRYLPELSTMCDWVRISLDAATSRTHSSLRPSISGRSNFEKIVDGIQQLASQANRRTSLGISFVVTSASNGSIGNLDEIVQFFELGVGSQCEYVEFKAEMDERHQIIPVTEGDKRRIAESLQVCDRLSRKATTELILSSSLRALLAGEPADGQPKAYKSCGVASLRTTVTPLGYFVCSYHRGNSRHSYGRPSGMPFDQQWAARGDHVDPSLDCSFHCARHDQNLYLSSLNIDSRDIEDDLQKPGQDQVDSIDPFI